MILESIIDQRFKIQTKRLILESRSRVRLRFVTASTASWHHRWWQWMNPHRPSESLLSPEWTEKMLLHCQIVIESIPERWDSVSRLGIPNFRKNVYFRENLENSVNFENSEYSNKILIFLHILGDAISHASFHEVNEWF